MPTYKYACRSCDHRFEEFQSITADPLSECPACHEAALKRLIGAGGGVIFKGSGFYVNDYARAGSSKGGASPPAESSKDSGASGGSSSEGSGSEKSCGTCGTTGPDVCD